MGGKGVPVTRKGVLAGGNGCWRSKQGAECAVVGLNACWWVEARGWWVDMGVCRKRVPVGQDAWLGSKTGAGALNMRASVSKMGAGRI